MKRLLGIGTRIQPVTRENVSAAKQDPASEEELASAKKQLTDSLKSLEDQSVYVRKLLANETLDIVARSGRRK